MDSHFIRELKERIPIAEVVGEYVRLRKTGSNLVGLCPFHSERSPSFSVSDKKKIFHCFGCQKSGDVISFIQEIQAVSFVDAIKILAHKYGLALPAEFSKTSSGAAGTESPDAKNQIFYKLNHFVAQFYHERLMSPEGAQAREYLQSRGISEETIRIEKLGVASQAWSDLTDFLIQKKAPLEVAESLGLIRKSDKQNKPYDFFRNRVIFPVLDMRGRVIAFGGRKLGNEEGPKYLNSAESPVFKKGLNLYGIFRAQKDIREADCCVIVEGFMDCLALQQAEVGYTVATLGTVLSAKQIAGLKRLTKNLVLIFDADEAGQVAQLKAMETCLAERLVVRGLVLPNGKDPDEFIQKNGADAMRALVQSAPYVLDQKMLELASEAGNQLEKKTRAIDQILNWISKIDSENARWARIEQMAGMFGFSSERLQKRLQEITPLQVGAVKTQIQPKSQLQPQRKTLKSLSNFALKCIELIVLQPESFISSEEILNLETREYVLAGLENEEASEIMKKLISCALQNKARNTPLAFDSEILNWSESTEIKAIFSRVLVTLDQDQDKQKKGPSTTESAVEVKDLISKLIRKGKEKRRDFLRTIILKADQIGDQQELNKHITEYDELVKSIGRF